MAILGHVADDLDELARRLDRIEELLRRSSASPSRVPPGPEVRSARSIVNRIDDVWVAVTEGNERVVATIDQLSAGAGGGAAVAGAGPAGQESPPAEALGPRLDGIEQALAALARPDTATMGEVADRLGRIEAALAARADVEEADPAVHLRLNRIEEALAGIAGRLDEPTAHRAEDRDGAAAVRDLEAEVRRSGQRIDALATALEASAARSTDGTLTDRLGRLRDQFRK